MAIYPGAIPTLDEIFKAIDDQDWMNASEWNDLRVELRAALVELGTLPKGAHADVKTRLNVQQHKIIDADGDSYEDVELTADADEVVTYLKDVLVRKFYSDGILDLNKQSRVRVYLNTPHLNLTSGLWTKMGLDVESYDNQSEFAGYKFTAKRAGFYLATGSVTFLNTSVIADKVYGGGLYKNGALNVQALLQASVVDYLICNFSTVISLAANDFLELYAIQLSGADTVDVAAGSTLTFLAVHKLS